MSHSATLPSPAPPAATVPPPKRTAYPLAGWFLLPAVAFLLVFFFYPLATIVWRGFSDPQLGLGNYTALLHDGVSVTVLLRTLLTALIVAVCTLLIAYPYAYAMTKASVRARGILTVLVLLPFWTSLMARNFAWYLLEQRGGLIEQALSAIGIDDVVLLGSVAGVTIAMVQVMLPYMVLPLYSSLSGIDRRLLDAAGSLGAPRVTAFRKVYLPLSLPGIVSGFSLVFIMTLGFYVTPTLLGSPQQSLISQLIGTQVAQLLDFGGAGALGSVLLVVTLLVLVVVSRIARPTAALSQAVDRG
ncbi:ABC transporter permease [Streptomyces shenzhenensis]|uniref:ABC transporter permease n=1 Tax=Streptomyces shenzhenensis TaxID=943815 RepID=UPI0033F813F7